MPLPDTAPQTPTLANYVSAGSSGFNIPGRSFTRAPLLKTKDDNGLWDDTNHWYVVPVTGIYFAVAWWRPNDNAAVNASILSAIQTFDGDSAGSRWTTFAQATASGTSRLNAMAVVLASYNKGDKIRLVTYVDLATATAANSAQLQIYQAA